MYGPLDLLSFPKHQAVKRVLGEPSKWESKIVHNFRQGRGGSTRWGQFFSGWIFGTRPDMSRMGESAVLAMENGGEEDCECEMHLSELVWDRQPICYMLLMSVRPHVRQHQR